MNNITNLPLSSNQKRLWIIEQYDIENPAYNLCLTYYLKGAIDAGILNRSIQLLFDRHHSLFSVFRQNDGTLYIDIIPREVKVELIDFSDIAAEKRRDEILSFTGTDTGKWFDLETGPLYRLYLLKYDDSEYYFHATIHHIVFDGWSRQIFVDELSWIYTDLYKGVEVSLKPGEYHSYDFAGQDLIAESGRDSEELKKFWTGYLEGFNNNALNLPFDRQRPMHSSGLGQVELFIIPENVTGNLKELAGKKGRSLFQVMAATLGLFLHKVTGDDDICIGIPVSTRKYNDKMARLLGFFVDTTVARFRFDRGNSLIDFIDHAGNIVREAVKNSPYSFEKIVEALNPSRIPGVNPYFQVTLSWLTGMTDPMDLGGIRGEKILSGRSVTPFDLAFYMSEKENTLEVEIRYSSDLFNTDTIQRLTANYLKLLDVATQDPHSLLSSFSIISDRELKMISEVNETAAEYSRDKTILSLFEERVILDPDSLALVHDSGEVTYRELDDMAARLASVLQKQGMGKGDFIGLITERSPELIACLLAIFKTGAAYVPLNIGDPEDRTNSIIRASELKYVIRGKSVKNSFPDIICYNIEDLLEESVVSGIKNNPETFLSTDPAYVIFTSGTTGIPKGVLVNHRSVINVIEWVNNTFSVSKGDKLLWVTNLSFDLSVYDIFGILSAGGTVRILNDDDRMDPEQQYEILKQEKITFWDSAPQSLQQLIPFFNANDSDDSFNNLRLVFLSGDWIPLTMPDTVRSVFPEAVIVSLGGATEATVWSNYFIADKIDPRWKSIPYGKPIQNARYYILNSVMGHCRTGESGDLYIGGDCLAMGYYKDPELTAGRFINDPFNKSSRLYITGDKARWMADGNIEFLGREDGQVKVRGYRVELGEIRKAVMDTGLLKDAVLIPDRTDKYNNKIILFVITEEGSAFETSVLINELRKILPGYMVPEKVLNYNTFPATKNGKTDTKALFETYLQSVKDAEQSGADVSDETEPGELTSTGSTIYKIWKEILKRSDLRLNENFFNAGGNSLMVITTINRIRESFGFKISFTEFLSHPTIEQLSEFLESRKGNDGEDIILVRTERTTRLPLTRNQKRLWFLLKMNPDLPIYTIRFGCKICGPFSAELFEKSLKMLLKEQSIMNTVVKEVDGEPYADIVKREPGIEFADYSGLPEDERSRMRDAILNTESIPVFDLENGPLYRSNLVKIDDNEHYFQIAVHHIIFDGWSQFILTKRLSEIYNALREGRKVDTAEQEYNQYDFALWENNRGSSSNDEKDLSFWKETLDDCPSFLKLPYDFKRPDTNSGTGSYETIILDGETTEKLRAVSESVNASLLSSLLGITGIFLCKLTGESDINIGLPVAYRPHSKLEGIFGMFVNTVLVRLLFSNELTFRDLLKLSHSGTRDAVAHSAFPFEEIVNAVNPERMMNVNPLFQAAFSWQNDFNIPLSIKEPVCEILKPKVRSVPFDIIFSFHEEGDTVAGEIEYSVDLFSRETICNMKEIFLELVERLVNEPDTAILSLPVISGQGIRKIEAFNNTRTSYPSERTIAGLFKDQVALYPDKEAIVFRGVRMTYRDLDILSGQIASTLSLSGLTGNSPVAVFGDKSPEVIAALIGILKAGGIYVPVDPEYPEDRISFILRDSGSRIILVQKKYTKHKFENITKIEIPADHNLSDGSGFKEKEGFYGESAYIMYTSGTTGKPKGSLIQQIGIIRLVRNINYMGLTSEDRILMTGALVFDATTFEIWGALLNGGTLYIAEKETILDPDAMGKELLENNITVLWLTSGLFTQLAEIRTDIFRDLKYLLVGGDVVSAPHINRVRRDNPQLKVINCYGPTENTTFSTTFLVDRDYDHNIPIGSPVSNSTAYIFDSNMNLLPPGIVGELYVGGDGLSTGYLNREDLNSISFRDNPYKPGERIYRTGDHAKWLPDGNIEFHGRRDNQVKVRGYRVEPDEIEAAISDIDEVVEAVVKPIKTENGDLRLIAFLNVTDGFSSADDDLRRKLKTKLPSYMIPSAFSIMKGFPKTINGKTDRKALVYNLNDVIPPAIIEEVTFTPSEKIIYEIWSEALKKKDIRLTDNFFDIGGNSLMAISVFSKIQKAFNKDLNLRLFFDSPRIKDIAEAFDLVLYDKKIKSNKRERLSKNESKIISGEIC
jgi:amino acid adenylation domain-containing protein